MLIKPFSLVAKTHPNEVADIWLPLKKAGYDANESDLLRAIRDNRSKTIVRNATLGLQFYGTRKAIPTLKSLKTYPDLDTRCVHVMSVAIIAKEEETPLYAELLADKSYKEKGYALAAMWEFGDKRGQEAILSFVTKAIEGKLSHKEWNWEYDPPYVIEYLRRIHYDELETLERTLSKKYLEEKWSLRTALDYKLKKGNLFR